MNEHQHPSRRTALSVAITCAIALSGCATVPNQDNNARVDEQNKALLALVPATPAPKIHEGAAPLEITPLDPAKQVAIERAWLRSKKVDFIPNKKNPAPIPANEVLKMFRENGINITSALPLDNYTYTGNGVKAADGETALQLILGQMGLDYETDEKGKYVTVVPMKSHSWTINLGHRTSYSNNSNFDSLCAIKTGQTTGTTGTPQASGATGMPGAYGASPGMPSASAGNTSGSTTSDSNVQTQENFWSMLTTELTQRLQVLIPVVPGAPAQPGAASVPAITPSFGPGGAMGGMGGVGAPVSPGGSALYTRQQIGHYAINPVTGQVTIQAPGWILKQIDAYMANVIMPMYNTTMTFEGTVANVRSSSDVTRGFDLTALASYAGKYGFALTNNILGGISMGTNNGIPSAAYGGAANLPGGGVAFGFTSPKDNLQIFNAFLTSLGGTEILNRPIVTVTSGVPVDFGRLTPIYTNEQSQTIAAGNVNASPLATIQNNIIEHQFGSLLRIMPHYDPKTKRVRAQVSLLQRPLVGYQNLTISLIGTNGQIINQTIRKPQIECSVTSTEAILDDGELIIIGGQIENTNDNTHAGVTGLMDIKGLDLFSSQKRDTGSRTTMYFALRVRLNTKAM